MILTREQKSQEIMRLEMLITKMEMNCVPYNQILQVLRKIQKLRDSL